VKTAGSKLCICIVLLLVISGCAPKTKVFKELPEEVFQVLPGAEARYPRKYPVSFVCDAPKSRVDFYYIAVNDLSGLESWKDYAGIKADMSIDFFTTLTAGCFEASASACKYSILGEICSDWCEWYEFEMPLVSVKKFSLPAIYYLLLMD